MAHDFEVVGYDDDDEAIAAEDELDAIEGDILGDIMGAAARRPVPLAQQRAKLLAARRKLLASRANNRRINVRKPGWRDYQLAPGVIRPDEGMIPLPLAPQANGGVFTSTINQIIFQGSLQKPYRGERLLVSVVRTGATATGRLLGQLFVGTDLQQADITSFDVEQFGAPTAFGTRLTTKPAQPGVLIRLIVTLSAGLTAPDTIFASINFSGRVVH